MAKHLIIIDGPVSESSFKNVKWSTQVDILAINHGIPDNGSNCSNPSNPSYNKPGCIGSGAFSNLGHSYPKENILSTIVKIANLNINNYSRICIAGFSAAHGLNEIIAQDESSRKLLTCLYAMDSYFTGGAPALKQGYYEFGKLALSDYSKAFIITTSDFGGPSNMPYLSGTDSINPLLEKLGVSTEKTINKQYRKGNFLYTNYGTSITHAQHATKLGPMNMENVISPWMTQLDGNKPIIDQNTLYLPSDNKSSKYLVGAFVVLGIAALVGSSYIIMKSKSISSTTGSR